MGVVGLNHEYHLQTELSFAGFASMKRLLREGDLALVAGDRKLLRKLRVERLRIFRQFVRCLSREINQIQAKQREQANALGRFDAKGFARKRIYALAMITGLRMAGYSYALRLPVSANFADQILFSVEYMFFSASPSTATI